MKRAIAARPRCSRTGPAIPIGSPSLRAIAQVRLGDIDAARAEAKAALAAAPSGFKAGTWKALNFARDPAVLDAQVADLVKAGLPP